MEKTFAFPKQLCKSWLIIITVVFLICFVLPGKILVAEVLTIKTNVNTILMGRSIILTAQLKLNKGDLTKNYILYPYVNDLRWGAQQRPDLKGKSTFIIPLPNPGIVHIQVIAKKATSDNWMGTEDKSLLIVGNPISDNKSLSSNKVEIKVEKRKLPKLSDDGHLYCIQYENWFEDSSWNTAEAVPVIGFYNSHNENVIRQHILWFVDIGINSIMLDWSNHIWGDTSWEQRGEGARDIINNTTFFLEVLAKMRDEGIEVPKVILMPGLSNGKPATVEALNEELNWIYKNYILNPRFKGLFQIYFQKPLIIILDTGVIGNKKGTAESAFRVPFFKQTLAMTASELDSFRIAQRPIDDTHFTVRYMSSQNQITKHNELGYWSWMDGQLKPIVTYFKGKPEAVTVTPSFFGPGGWTSPESYGRKRGTTYIKTFEVALKNKPSVIFFHQFNEFTGQKNGQGYGDNKNVFLDEYNVELSDDIEPVSLIADGYRGDTGGWGFYYLNLTQALINIFKQGENSSTILAVNTPVISKDKIKLKWSIIGKSPKSYTIAIDSNTILKDVTGNSCDIPIKGIKLGKHIVTVKAHGVFTHYPLSKINIDLPSINPIPVIVTRKFILK